MNTGTKLRRITALAGMVLREFPENTAWAISKGLKVAASAPASSLSSVARGATTQAEPAVRRRPRQRTRRRVMRSAGHQSSRHDSVEPLFRNADEAAERARQAEQRALVLAEAAKEAAEETARVRDVASQRLVTGKRKAAERKGARVDRARKEAGETVAQVTRMKEEEIRRARHQAKSSLTGSGPRRG